MEYGQGAPSGGAIRITHIDAAGTRIAVHRTGAGRAVVCLHAIGHGARDYYDLMRRLGGRYDIVAVDWPGHGDSPADTQPASADRYTAILSDLLRHLDLGEVVLIGNSVGGAVAIKIAAAIPAAVRGLVLCDPAGLQRVGLVARFFCRWKARFFAAGERGDPGFAHRFRRYYERQVLPEPAALARREEIIAAGYQVAAALRQGWESFGRPSADIRSLTTGLRCPVLYAWARKDRLIALSRCRAAVAATPRHEFVLFDAGHSAFLEQPDAFEAALRTFLGNVQLADPQPARAGRL